MTAFQSSLEMLQQPPVGSASNQMFYFPFLQIPGRVQGSGTPDRAGGVAPTPDQAGGVAPTPDRAGGVINTRLGVWCRTNTKPGWWCRTNTNLTRQPRLAARQLGGHCTAWCASPTQFVMISPQNFETFSAAAAGNICC